MAKITVYYYEIYDPHSRSFIKSKSPATRRAIDAAGGVILVDTAQEVDIEMVNQDGVVVRWPATDAKPSPKKPAKDFTSAPLGEAAKKPVEDPTKDPAKK
jgi:hypothetical protein